MGEFARTIQKFSYFLFADSIFPLEIFRLNCHDPLEYLGEGLYIMDFAYCLHIVFVIGKKTDNFSEEGFFTGSFPWTGKFPGINFYNKVSGDKLTVNFTPENFPELL